MGMCVIAPEHVDQYVHNRDKESNSTLKHILSANHKTSASIGFSNNASIITTHVSGDCKGLNCACYKVASYFLQRSTESTLENFVNENISFLRENVSFPYLFVVLQDSDLMCVSSHFAEDFLCQRLENGSYEIRYVCELSKENTFIFVVL